MRHAIAILVLFGESLVDVFTTANDTLTEANVGGDAE